MRVNRSDPQEKDCLFIPLCAARVYTRSEKFRVSLDGTAIFIVLVIAKLLNFSKLKTRSRLPVNGTNVCYGGQRAVVNRLVSLREWMVGHKSTLLGRRICCLEGRELRCVRSGVWNVANWAGIFVEGVKAAAGHIHLNRKSAR